MSSESLTTLLLLLSQGKAAYRGKLHIDVMFSIYFMHDLSYYSSPSLLTHAPAISFFSHSPVHLHFRWPPPPSLGRKHHPHTLPVVNLIILELYILAMYIERGAEKNLGYDIPAAAVYAADSPGVRICFHWERKKSLM